VIKIENKTKKLLVKLGVVLIILCIYLFVPAVKKNVNQMVFYLSMLNLDAIKEIVIENVNGFIFDNSIEDLCQKIREIYNERNIAESIKEKARNWVQENRDWKQLSLKYKNEYDDLKKQSSNSKFISK